MAELFNPLRGRNASNDKGGGFNRLAAGRKTYGAGRPYPNIGKKTAAAQTGYAERDARRNAIMKRYGRA